MKRTNRSKWLALALCALMLAGLLVSCSASNESFDVDADYNEAPMSPEVGIDGAGGSVDKSEIGDSLQNETTEKPDGEYETKIIKTAEVIAETKDFDKALTELEQTVKALGGYVEASSIRGTGYNTKESRAADYTLRIPAEKLDEFLAQAGTLVHVTKSSSTATDVSGTYYDIEARLSVLETERQVLEQMLSQTTNVTNMISIEQRLYDVIYEIESYKTMLKVYDKKVAYSTVTLYVCEVEDLTVVKEENTFGSRFKAAFQESWQNFADFCKDFVIVLVYAFPTLLVLGVLGLIFVATILIVVKIISVIVKKRKKKKARKAEQA